MVIDLTVDSLGEGAQKAVRQSSVGVRTLSPRKVFLWALHAFNPKGTRSHAKGLHYNVLYKLHFMSVDVSSILLIHSAGSCNSNETAFQDLTRNPMEVFKEPSGI